MPQPVQRLSPGPLDIVGDVHGELGALRALLSHLGYDAFGQHPEGRTLVFLGDLVDRGPDSPGVVEKVSGLYFAKRAQCLLGNHELRLLNQVSKPDNSWTSAEAAARAQRQGWRAPMRVAHALQLRAALTFFYELPVALERSDLRLVHACWDPAALAALPPMVGSWSTLFARYRRNIAAELKDRGWSRREVSRLKELHPLYRPPEEGPPPPFVPELCEYFSLEHNLNPLRVLTQGPQGLGVGEAPFWSGFRWQMSDRQPWWKRYDEAIPVVFGHYWRPRYKGTSENSHPSLFEGRAPEAWLGARGSCFCLDFAVGLRSQERLAHPPAPPRYEGALAALRVPAEGARGGWELVFDDGARVDVGRGGEGR